MGDEPRGSYSSPQIRTTNDGITFGTDWRVIVGPNGPVWQNEAAGNFAVPTRFSEVGSKAGMITVTQGTVARKAEATPISAAYTTVFADRYVSCNASGGAFTVTLLPAATAGTGYHLSVGKGGVDTSVNIITIDANGAETINGALTYTISRQYEWCELLSDGTNWTTTTHAGDEGTKVVHKVLTATATLTLNDNMVECNATAGAFTVNLPTASSAGRGFKYGIGKSDSSTNVVTIDAAGTETINGALTYLLANHYQGVEIASDGTNWVVLNAHPGHGGGTGGAGNTARITSAATSIPVTHNAGYTPHSSDIFIVPITDWGTSARWWISAVTSTTFTITVNAAPGANFDFAWKIIR